MWICFLFSLSPIQEHLHVLQTVGHILIAESFVKPIKHVGLQVGRNIWEE